MRLPSTICLHLALLALGGSASTVALAATSPTEGSETHAVTVAEDDIAAGISFTFIREGDPKKPFTLVEGGEEDNPVKLRSVKSAPVGVAVSLSGSTFTLKGSSPTSGTLVLETQFRDLVIDLTVNEGPVCDGEFKQIVGNSQRDVLLQPADLCIDVEGDALEVTDVAAVDGSTLKVSYNDDGSATVHLPSGEGSEEIAYKVSDGDNNGGGGFTIVSRDWDFFYRGAPGYDTTGTFDDMAEQVSTKEDPLEAVDVELIDPDEQLSFTECCGGFTLTFPDFDPVLRSPVLEGEFADAEGTPVRATWDIVYNEVPTCTDGKGEAEAGVTTVTLPLASSCKDPEGDTLTVESVTVDGKEVDYKVDEKTGELFVSLPRVYKSGESSKVEARVSDGVKEGEPLTGPILFTITFRDDF